jgi:hypothetical protein
MPGAGDELRFDPDRKTVHEERDQASPVVAMPKLHEIQSSGPSTDHNGSSWLAVTLRDGRSGYIYLGRAEPASRRALFFAMLMAVPLAVVGGILVLVYSGKPKPVLGPTESVVIENGESHVFKAGSTFAFWKSVVPSEIQPDPNAQCAVLTAAQQKELLDSAEILAPEGLEVRALGLDLQSKPATAEFSIGNRIRQSFRVDYVQYVLSGRWKVAVPEGFPEGKYTVTIRLKALAKVREELGASHPTDADDALWFEDQVAIALKFQTHNSGRK